METPGFIMVHHPRSTGTTSTWTSRPGAWPSLCLQPDEAIRWKDRRRDGWRNNQGLLERILFFPVQTGWVGTLDDISEHLDDSDYSSVLNMSFPIGNLSKQFGGYHQYYDTPTGFYKEVALHSSLYTILHVWWYCLMTTSNISLLADMCSSGTPLPLWFVEIFRSAPEMAMYRLWLQGLY